MEKTKKIKLIFALIYTFFLGLFLFFFFTNFTLQELTSYEFIKNNRNFFLELREKNFFLLSILFIVFTIIWVLAAGFGSPIALIAGFIFGKWFGFIYAVLGLSLGATLLYIFANYFLKDLVEEKFSKKFSNLNEKFKKNEFIFFIIYRFVGGIPFQIQNILPVLFNVKLKNYFFGSVLGMTPQIFVGTTLGSGINEIIQKNIEVPSLKDLLFSQEIYAPIIAFIILIIIGIIVKNIFYKN